MSHAEDFLHYLPNEDEEYDFSSANHNYLRVPAPSWTGFGSSKPQNQRMDAYEKIGLTLSETAIKSKGYKYENNGFVFSIYKFISDDFTKEELCVHTTPKKYDESHFTSITNKIGEFGSIHPNPKIKQIKSLIKLINSYFDE